MQHEYDVVIVGGGMVGASLACAIAPTNLSIALIESIALKEDQQPSYDDRGISLSPSSKRILEYLDVWDDIYTNATPIKNIHVSNQGRFGFTHLTASELNVPELGHVVIAKSLGHALHKKLSHFKNIKILCPIKLQNFERKNSKISLELLSSKGTKVIDTKLLIGADGSHSKVRSLANIEINKNDYKQTAIVSNITTQKPNQNTAYERFTSHGPIALLPIDKNRSVLVFTTHSNEANQYLSMPDNEYIKIIEKEFGRRLGEICKLEKRCEYPIFFIEAKTQYQENIVLIGNSAHTVHPNAAQGFNLGLRDVAGLAECITNGLNRNLAIDDIDILKRYIDLRSADQKNVIDFCNSIANCFYNKSFILNSCANAAMISFDCVPELKSLLLKRAMGVAGYQPRLVRGLNL